MLLNDKPFFSEKRERRYLFKLSSACGTHGPQTWCYLASWEIKLWLKLLLVYFAIQCRATCMWSLFIILIMQMTLAEDSYLRVPMLLIWNSKTKLDIGNVFCCSLLIVLEKEYNVICLL